MIMALVELEQPANGSIFSYLSRVGDRKCDILIRIK